MSKPSDKLPEFSIPLPVQYPPELPISQRREEIIAAMRQHQTIVLTGETGSGKTTQIPKMCIDAGLGRKGRIACTQPRRVAALSVAKRVAEELQVDFGAEVGAKIRFTDQTNKSTRVKFMTDGMLLTEIHADPLMRDYEAVIIDEAHERSLNIDFLLGHLNQLRSRRPDLKIVITSATIDTDKFSAAFDEAPIIEVSGRVYPVDIVYAPLDELLEESGDFTYIQGIVESTQRIQTEFGNSGDILAFLPTEKDIREAMDAVEDRFRNRLEVIPCFGRLSNADQQRIFQSSPKRKLILSTNIAETSLTIPGIRFVIDAGLARISRYNPRGRTKRLPIVKVSQSSANQRAGRCGRVADGVCIRLYSEKDYLSRPVYSVPEIQRSNLADVILRMTASRLGNVETFPFIDPPTPAAITAGYQLLQELGALESSDSDKRSRLTKLGRQLARLPADPTVGRMLLEAEQDGVTHEVLVIASALSIQDPRERPMDKDAAARQAHAQFDHQHSDFLTLLNIWEALHDDFEKLSQSRLRKFCKKNFLNYLRIREWRDIYQQLERSLPKKRENKPHKSFNSDKGELTRDSARYQAIHTCLLTGLLANVGQREDVNLYKCSSNRKPLVFPGSSLFIRQPRDKNGKRKTQANESKAKKRKSPEWILSGEIVETNRLYARTVASIDPNWILEVGRHILSYSYSDPEFLTDQGRVAARESIRIHGLEIQNKQVSYLKVDPVKATEIFIREALLNEDYQAPANWTFLESNRKLISRIQNAQTVISVAHWMGVEEAAFRFYRDRLRQVASIADLNRVLKNGGIETLVMSETDLTASEEAAIDLSLFPESVTLENSALPIEYQYKHGDRKDGVTLKLPYHKTKSVNDAMLDWLIPGHLEAKIHALFKALPKATRQQLQPLAEKAKTVAGELRPTGQTLVDALKSHLLSKYSIETYSSDWDVSAIPEHLKARVEVHDKKGRAIAEARDTVTLRQELARKEAELSATKANDTSLLWKKARQKHERTLNSISELKGAHLPKRIQIGSPQGIPLYAYPALRASGETLEIQLFRSEEDARLANKTGISALLAHELRRELAWIRSDLKDVQRVGPAGVVFRPIKDLKEDVYAHIEKDLSTHDLDTIDFDTIYEQRERAHEKSKGILYRVVDQLKLILEKRQSLVVDQELLKAFGKDIDRLLPPNFLRHTPSRYLSRFPVYLETISHRAKTRNQNPKRDTQRQVQVDQFRNRLNQLAKTGKDANRIDELRWQIDEFAVSLFAQHLGTAYPISAKKLEQAFAEAGSPETEKSTVSISTKTAENQPTQKVKSKDRPTQADLDSLKKLFG
ncbi:ATP-dependent RNA helicase HrpA [Pelagicoccus albus]|uniref:ATP-dependent RNA helicase HrpA n=1 Tax=Pelagicoccus albus TaxID=415222 RepID=A0A7X1B8V7_9BACT|nr:ATP-dependent RNA helicase HrpA [Pelagicoccus albus]MBC2606538.1 ATP-dependent RNA helicase HrpA [Pelagicoccus albus]